MLTSLRKFLMAQSTRWSDPRVVLWYGLSLLFATYYGYLALQTAFSDPYYVQDDARQHVFWMLRFVEPDAFPDDFMADYFQANAPIGYAWLYRTAAAWGIHPYMFSKILPPVLGLLGTHYCFRLSLQIMPLPVAAFTSTLVLNQSLWMRDDLMSGTPRAFLYVLLLAFLVYANRRAVIPCLVVLVLQPLIYPVSALLSAAILAVRLFRMQPGRITLTSDLKEYWLSGLGLAVLVVLLSPYALADHPFGPTVTPAAARTMLEFGPGGRSTYYTNNPIQFWFGDRSGIIPTPIFTPPTMAFSLLFPWLWWRSHSHWMQTIRASAAILQQMVVASFLLFLAAHLLLYRLYLPSRYTHHTLRILFALTASFAIWILIDWLLQKLLQRGTFRRQLLRKSVATSAIGLITVSLLGYSEFLESFPTSFNSSRRGVVPELYEFFRETPKDTIIASLTKETSNLHVFAQRSPLISPELGIPYHTGYYQQFRQRVGDLINAQYSHSSEAAKAFIKAYKIDYWLIDDKVFSPESLVNDRWFQQHQPEAEQALSYLKNTQTPPFLEQAKSHCTVLKTTLRRVDSETISKQDAQQFWLLDANCLLTLN